jgi:hypothetical protein
MPKTLFKLMVPPMLAVGLLMTVPAYADGRVVAIGDVHGEYEGLVSILETTGLIDAELRWIGGDTTLVQTGDLFDRGLEVRKVLDLMMRLQQEAAAAGGEIVMLYGNHETMVLTGFYRDVNPDMYATFADKKTEKIRKNELRAFRDYWQTQSANEQGVKPPFPDEIRDRWLAAHPLGMIEFQEMLGPNGLYGKWLRTFQTVALIDGVLFAHGGIGPQLKDVSPQEINAKVADEIATFDRIRTYLLRRGVVPTTAGLNSLVAASQRLQPPDPKLAALDDVDDWFIISPEGPLWFRGSASWSEEERGEEMKAILDGFGAQAMVNAHTPQATASIGVRFDGRVFLIDTGMLSSHYGGRASALVIEDGVFTAVYADGETEVLLDTALADAA